MLAAFRAAIYRGYPAAQNAGGGGAGNGGAGAGEAGVVVQLTWSVLFYGLLKDSK